MTTTPTKQRKDRPIRWAILVAVLTIVALAGFNFLVLEESTRIFSFEAADDTSSDQDETDDSTLVPINLEANIPASLFLEDLSENTPGNLSSPSVDLAANPNNALAWVCNYEPDPFPVAAMNVSHPSENASVTVHAYGAGQGKEALDGSRSAVSSCAGRQGSGGIYTASTVVPDAPGFSAAASSGEDRQYVSFFLRGDVLISVASPTFSRTVSISKDYDAAIMELLPPVCENLEVSEADAQRNPYYDRESYTGWERGRAVAIYTDSEPALVPGVLSSHRSSNGDSLPRGNFPDGTVFVPNTSSGVRLSYSTAPNFTRPLDPIPAEMPTVVETPGDPPGIPERPTVERTIPERVEDPVGPGCGWAFTSVAAPPFDASEEKERADAEEERVRAEMRERYRDYLNDRRAFIFEYAEYAKTVYEYENYVDEVREVGTLWEYVNSVRSDYRSRLDAYWRDLDAFESFAERRSEAQDDYDEIVQQCRADLPRLQNEWRDEMTRYEELVEEREDTIERAREQEESPTSPPGDNDETPSPRPSPSPTPSIPPEPEHPGDMPVLEDCVPSRPAILDQSPPMQPVPPTPPADVELPSSWDDIP